jgi:5-methylcytosine-specific restriction protein A
MGRLKALATRIQTARLGPPTFTDHNGFNGKYRGTAHSRGYGAAWQKLRADILRRDENMCQVCADSGRVSVATEVDHIIPKVEGGTDDPSNLQAICHTCHEGKTMMERRGGSISETRRFRRSSDGE